MLIPVKGKDASQFWIGDMRDRPRKGDGERSFSPERGEDLEDEMVYDEET